MATRRSIGPESIEPPSSRGGPTSATLGDPLRFHPTNPSRPPDWRWRRASLLADGLVRTSRRRDDEWVLRGMRFLKALRRCRDDGHRDALMRRMPDLYAAHAVYSDAVTQRRWSLEARLLAKEPFDAIATKCGITAEAVASYEQTFFSVLENIDRGHIDWVLFSAIGLPLRPGPIGLDEGTLWRLFGYSGGPWVVDILVDPFLGQARPERCDRANAFMDDHIGDMLLRKLAFGVLTLTVDNGSAAKLLDIYLGMLANERRARESTAMMQAIRPNVLAMWESLPPFVKEGAESPTTEMLGIARSPGLNGSRS